MLVNLEETSNTINKIYDICIIGAGVAGITIANELIKKQISNICVVESGSFNFEEETQSLYEGDISLNSAPHAPLEQYRMRYFGGTSNAWGGAVLPYSEIDLKNNLIFQRVDG